MLLERRRVVSLLNEEAARPTIAGALDTEMRTLHSTQTLIYLRGAGFTEGARVKTKETTIVTFIYTLDPVVLLLRQQE